MAADLLFYSPTFVFLMRGCPRAAGTPSTAKIIMCRISPWGSRNHYSLLRSGGDICPRGHLRLLSLDLKFKEQEGAEPHSIISKSRSGTFFISTPEG
jgi:hypothetical protein